MLKYAAYMRIYANFWHDLCICDFENTIICRKICDVRVLAKYAIAYAIAYSLITSIPNPI